MTKLQFAMKKSELDSLQMEVSRLRRQLEGQNTPA
jgi:hypothetical protein